jgi:phytoene dehydrogenase-like protein
MSVVRERAVVVGAGHNGLVAANYLADAGLAVTVLECRPVVGGACVTEELIPGFRASSCAFVAGPGLEPRIVRDLGLGAFGLDLYQSDPLGCSIARDGRSFSIYRELDRTLVGLERRFGQDEVERFVRFGSRLQRVGALARPAMLADPPSLADLRAEFERLGEAELFEPFLGGSIGDLLDEYLRAEELKGFFAFLGLTSVHGGPRTRGTAYIFSHHSWGEFDGRFGEFGFARGGMGGISNALAARAAARGVEIRTDAEVARILVKDGRVAGVALLNGEEIASTIVVSNADPQRTFLKLVGEHELDPAFVERVRGLDYRGTMGRVHIAIDRLPRFTGFAPDASEPHGGVTLLGADLGSFERAWAAQQAGVLDDDPSLEFTIQSVHDDTLAPPGMHIVTTGVQQLPFELAEGTWDDARSEFTRRVLKTLESYAPGFESSVVGVHTITPLDLERDYRLTRGNIFHGAMTESQLFADRPLAGSGRYRSPVSGLYLCGAGTHPGGGVTGAPGHNSARAVLSDLGGQFGGEPAEWRRARRRPGSDHLNRLLEGPRSRRVLVRLARQRWLRPVVEAFRSRL